MSFEKGDHVVLRDKHSDFDGETGEVTQVMETMFGDEKYTISFEDGQEAGVPGDQIEAAEDEEAEAEDEEAEAENEEADDEAEAE